MNKRKILGYVIWLIAFLIPLQPAILSADEVGNTTGLVSFVALVVLVFAGYLLWESGRAEERAQAGHQ